MPSKKLYQILRKNNEKPINVIKSYCSNISWFVIIICSIISVFLLLLIPSKYFINDRSLTLDVVNANSVEKPVTVAGNRFSENATTSVEKPGVTVVAGKSLNATSAEEVVTVVAGNRFSENATTSSVEKPVVTVVAGDSAGKNPNATSVEEPVTVPVTVVAGNRFSENATTSVEKPVTVDGSAEKNPNADSVEKPVTEVAGNTDGSAGKNPNANSVEKPATEVAGNRFAGNDADGSAGKNPNATSVEESVTVVAGNDADGSAGKNPNATPVEESVTVVAGKNPNATSVEEFVTVVAGNDADGSAGKNPNATPVEKPVTEVAGNTDECAGKYVYIQELPTKFNSDLLKTCEILNPFVDECTALKNSGLGPWLNLTDETVFSGQNWYETDQWSIEVIFHNRMKQYKCLTNDSSKASAVFVPFYSGLDVSRYLWNSNVTLRDGTGIELVDFISRKPEWKRVGGRDHFLVVGRMTWDFSRDENGSGWGSRLLQLPETKSMTSLLLEASPTSKSEFGVPYPTYFHPSSGFEVGNWQEKIRAKNRSFLFSFAGAPRPNDKESIRNVLIEQCLASTGGNCEFLYVHSGINAENIMNLFQSSDFCLQPPGDSFTRKSSFDTILAGCIPVFFHPGSAYIHYTWHLPRDYSSYSVLIPIDEVQHGNVSIEKTLLEIPRDRVRAMREEVIRLIPRIVYANPNEKVEGFEDAFEVAVKGVLSRVEGIKRDLEGRETDQTDQIDQTVTSESRIPDQLAWKYKLYGNLENHELDKYFGF